MTVMLNFPQARMKSSTSFMEHTFLEQKPYGILERTLESESSVLTLALTSSHCETFSRPATHAGVHFFTWLDLNRSQIISKIFATSELFIA